MCLAACRKHCRFPLALQQPISMETHSVGWGLPGGSGERGLLGSRKCTLEEGFFRTFRNCFKSALALQADPEAG